MCFNASFVDVKIARVDKNLLSDYFVDLLDGRLGFGTRLVLIVIIFDG